MNNLIGLITAHLVIMVMITVEGEPDVSSTCTCRGGICYALILGAVNFQSSGNICQKINGVLMTVRSAESDETIGDMLVGARGDFWIGLRLPEDRCSDTDLSLRGYEWTSGFQTSAFSSWKDNKNVCAPQCVSVSTDRTWTERPCQDHIDGCLCENVSESACQKPLTLSHNVRVIYSEERCDAAPCQHKCADVHGGYTCSCHDGYIPSRNNPHLCQMHCSSANCSAICDRQNQCICPAGFILSLDYCLDINECDNNYCDQLCHNTLGGFFCACKSGYSLHNVVKCVKTEIVSLTKSVHNDSGVNNYSGVNSVNNYASVNNYSGVNKSKSSSASIRSVVGMCIFFAAAVISEC